MIGQSGHDFGSPSRNVASRMDNTLETKPQEQNAMDGSIGLLDIAAKSALHSAIQQPMEGICQLVGIKAPKLFSDSGKYEFNTPQWYASTIGHGAGFMLPYWATSKFTGLATRAIGVQKAMLDGALSGLLFTPTGEGDNPVTGRAMAAFNSSVMFGTQHYLASELASRFVLKGMPLVTRLGINTVSGMAAGLGAMEASSVVSGRGFVTDKNVLIENAVAGAATGFALDAANIGFAKLTSASKPIEGSVKVSPQSTPLLMGTVEPIQRAAEQSTASGSRATTDGSHFSEPCKQTAEWNTPGEAIQGSKQYTSESGKLFWQTPDGRIFYTETRGEAEEHHIWSPYGSGKPAAYVGYAEDQMGRPIWVCHEPQGLYFYGNQQQDTGFFNVNVFKHGKEGTQPELSPELRERLTLSVPQHVEPDVLAGYRILRTADGADYENTTIKVRMQKPGVNPPDNLTSTDYTNNWTIEQETSARLYHIMSGDAVIRQHELTAERLRAMSTPIVVPEEYAQNLDRVRELRRTAVLDPEKNPEQAEQILAMRRELFLSRYRDRLLPEHWGQFLDVVPNRQTIQELQLLDSHSPGDPDGIMTAATERSVGRVLYFGDHSGIPRDVRCTLLHEWAHTIEESQPVLQHAFEWAAKLEKFVGRKYAETNEHENWAVHLAEMMMDPNPELFLTFAHSAPIRTVLLGEALRREMYSSQEHQSINLEELQSRLDYIDSKILPKARQEVMDSLLYEYSPLRIVSDTVEMLDNLATSKSLADRDLAHKLVDTDAIIADFDKQAKALRGENFFSLDAARVLQRYDLLLQMVPDAAEPRMEKATELAARTKRRLHLMLRGGPQDIAAALDTAEEMFRTTSTAQVIRRTVPFDDLANVAVANSDPSFSARAFEILRKSFDLSRVHPVALDMVKSGASGIDAAAKFICRPLQFNHDSFT